MNRGSYNPKILKENPRNKKSLKLIWNYKVLRTKLQNRLETIVDIDSDDQAEACVSSCEITILFVVELLIFSVLVNQQTLTSMSLLS
jgi:hypothetical protein